MLSPRLTTLNLATQLFCSVSCSPAGWDSVKKIAILSEHFKTIQPDDAFDDHIVKPIQRKVGALRSRTHFETEAKGNLEITYWNDTLSCE